MARSLTPILLGLDYQAVWFWIQACRLLQPSSPVLKVIFESTEIKTFDDVVVYYKNPIIDERGGECNADYYQIKFHVDHAGSLGYKAFADPTFIGATRFSLLEKLRATQNLSASVGQIARYHLVSPWQIDPQDPLARLISQQGGEIRLDVLNDKTLRTVDQYWQDHLSVDGAELAYILRGLRIHSASNLTREREHLNLLLNSVGLIPSTENQSIKPYEDLIRKCLAQGINEFTRDRLIEVCSREGLWVGQTPWENGQAIRLGVRSFLHWAEYMEDETDYMICFLKHFDNRQIRNPQLWREAIFPELTQFIRQHIRRGPTYHLLLDAHSSIAFASGYLLSKSGADVSPIQKTGSSPQVWRPSRLLAAKFSPDWQSEIIIGPGGGEEVALAISITHEITQDVKMHIESNLPLVKRLIACSLGEHVGNTSIRDADHAIGLAHSLQKLLHKIRTKSERSQILHIFASAPNGFLFFLGKFAMDFGQVIIYEYDFGSGDPAAYSPSLAFPPFEPLMGENPNKISR
jgi:hypothetical protein